MTKWLCCTDDLEVFWAVGGVCEACVLDLAEEAAASLSYVTVASVVVCDLMLVSADADAE